MYSEIPGAFFSTLSSRVLSCLLEYKVPLEIYFQLCIESGQAGGGGLVGGWFKGEIFGFFHFIL